MNAAERTAALAAIADKTWALKLEEPYMRHAAGLVVERIPAGTLEESEATAARAASLLRELEALDVASLGRTDRLTAGFLASDLRTASDAPFYWQYTSAVAPYSTMMVPYIAQQVIAPRTAAEPDQTLSLWTDFATHVRNLGGRALAQAAQGHRLAQPAIAPAIASLKGQKAMVENVLRSSAWPDSHRDGAEALCRDAVTPAFDAWIAVIDNADYAAAAPAQVGLMHSSGGDEAYRRLVRLHLTRDVPAEELHALGHAQIAMLGERMAEVRSRLGFTGTEQEFHASLATNPRVYARSAEEVEARYRSLMASMDARLPGWFRGAPKSPAQVARLPLASEAGMTYGFYDRPKAVGEPGTYYYNGSGLEKRSQLQAAALIYHELAPGHHYHLSRQMELDRLPAIRRNSTELTIFNEGWAEYASGIAGEMGLYDDPYDMYGRLVHERFVSQRLVVDTGMNALGWSLQQARDYMRANTLEGEAQVASETLRYSTDLPAQALAYRYGYLEFMRLREEARARQGAAFDVRDFHEAVLSEGALPLPVLEQSLAEALP